MGKRIDKVTGETRYYIPVSGKMYETSEEVYKTYYKMLSHEQYQEKRKRKYESSYEELEETGFQIENNSNVDRNSAEDRALNNMMIEKMLSKLSILNDFEYWLVQEIYSHGKTDRQIESESGISRSKVGYQRKRILEKLRLEMEK